MTKSLPVLKCLVFDSNDNVGVLTMSRGQRGQMVKVPGLAKGIICLKNSVPKGHKIAIRNINKNKPIIKFGEVIGIANQSISPGEHVHTHNIRFSNDILFFKKSAYSIRQPLSQKREKLPEIFRGFLRRDGRAGIRNYILVVSTVNCSATVVREIANYFNNADCIRHGIDGIIPIIHVSGCAQPIRGRANIMLNKTLAGWLCHPNVVGALIVGLGCEDVTLETIMHNAGSAGTFDKTSLGYLKIQEIGGTKKTIDFGIKAVKKMLAGLPIFKRGDIPVSCLTVALKCGGSDSYSGLTANPALGATGDILVSLGGTIALAEIPECWGAEKILSQRCASKEARNKLRQIFSWWKAYGDKNDINMNSNLSRGNREGGISTIIEKSLGAVGKCGTSTINQVVGYAERITKKGLVLMNTPGFDPIAVTGLVAGGCNMVAFTTGRGSTYGCSIAPTVKIATNSEIYRKLRGDIDIDAGKALTQNNVAEVGCEIYKFFIKVASGYKTCSESHEMGREEFVPWGQGENL